MGNQAAGKSSKQPALKQSSNLRPEKRKEIIGAAYLKAQDLKYFEIAEVLYPGASKGKESTVSRLVKAARDAGYLTEVFTPDNSATEADFARWNMGASGRTWNDLQHRLFGASATLKSIHVCFSGLPTQPGNISLFASNAAPHVNSLLMSTKTGIAVAWGPTLSEVAKQLQVYRARHKSDFETLDIPVFPTVGLPYGLQGSATDWSATQVARTISQALCNNPDVPSLDTVPPVLTGEFASEPKRSIILDFLREQPGFRQVFGTTNDSNDGLIHRADALITGVGTSERWPRFGIDGPRPDEATAPARRDFPGNIAGVPVGTAEQVAEKARFRRFRAQWNGLTLTLLKGINERAGKYGPGLILCAMGAQKCSIIRESIKRLGIVSHLIIDPPLAEALHASFRSAR